MLIPPQIPLYITEHLQHNHCDAHNPQTHVLIHIPTQLPHYMERKFIALPPFALLPGTYPDTGELSLIVFYPNIYSVIYYVCIVYVCYHCLFFSSTYIIFFYIYTDLETSNGIHDTSEAYQVTQTLNHTLYLYRSRNIK